MGSCSRLLRGALARLGVVALAGAGAAGAALADGLAPGEWKLTETIMMNGSKMPTQARTRCMTPEQVADLEKMFSPEYRTVNSGCERTEFKSSPTGLSWRMICTGQMNMDVAGNFVFDNPNHYTATITSRGEMAGRLAVESNVAIEGERIGECR
jgi:hypothetical protein